MEHIKLDLRGETGVLTICREEALNALNTGVLKELEEAVEAVAANRGLRCLIITGQGARAFVAGADIAEMLAKDPAEGEAFSRLGSGVLLRLERLPMPTVAAVNGYALGGGFELALSCDIRIASDNAVLGLPEVGLGLFPGWGGMHRLARVAGPGRAKELIFTGRAIPAKEAFAMGVVNHVYPQETLMDEAARLANQIASSAPVAVRLAKQALHAGMHMDMADALELDAGQFGKCFATGDAKKGMSAFLNKEKGVRFDNL